MPASAAQETVTATQEIDDDGDPPPEPIDEDSSSDDGSSSESDSDDDDLFADAMDTDEEDQNDFMTDEEAEVASDREETLLSWPHPKTWEKDKKVHPLLEECGDAQWRVPADRTSCKTQETGPPQDGEFRARVTDKKYLSLFLDALPVSRFWKRAVERQSKVYGENKVMCL